MKSNLSLSIILVITAFSLYWACTGPIMTILNTLEEIQTADQASLRAMYQEYRGEFGAWIQRYYKTDDETAGEIYQQAFIAFYYNIKDGKIRTLTSSLKTYLYAIGKNIAREQLRHQTRFVPPSDITLGEEWDTSVEDNIELNERQQQLKSVLDSMGDPCKSVLQLFYFENYSMEAIAEKMNYKTPQIAAKRKFICLQQIRTMLKDSVYFNSEIS